MTMKKSENITGLRKLAFYVRMSLECALRYWRHPSALVKASRLTRIFYRHKLKRLASGEYKLDFYLPRYPSQAFFTALEDKVAARPPRPVSVVLSISKACAYKCPHCYQRKDEAHELPLPVLIENVRKMRDFGIVAWAVEGGEPLIRFDRLEAVLAEISGLEVWVNSTGYTATPEKIRRLAELKTTGVMSSIHSIDRDAHDAFTGVAGSWRRALEFLRDCRETGMLTGFNTVLSDSEVVDGGIDRIMSFASEHGCDYVQLIHPKACGAWMGKAFDRSLHAEAVRVACEAQRHYNSAKSRIPTILTAQVYEESPEMLGCCCGGIDRFYVGAGGEVQPCEFVNISFGNLEKDGFETAYERMRKAFPVPCEEWTCERHAKEIAAAAADFSALPLPWSATEKLVAGWKTGTPTKVYEKMGIYRKVEKLKG